MAARSPRIAHTLAALSAENRPALVPFLTIGDPDLAVSKECILAAAESGADIIELGVPFSDPIADGPVIQASSQRALAAGSSLPRVLEMVAELRVSTQVPFILFGYYNPFFRYGEERLARAASEAGCDGLLCVDLPPEEAAGMVRACRNHGMDSIFLLAPTSGAERIRAACRYASGFVYFVAVTGVTGARANLPDYLPRMVENVKDKAEMPVGVGFGISTPSQAGEVGSYADLVIVGSALVRTISEAGAARAPAAVARFVSALRTGIDAARR
ncbi:MAG: tryptophan synthase subunit alpha [Candidatus Binatia bacterium]